MRQHHTQNIYPLSKPGLMIRWGWGILLGLGISGVSGDPHPDREGDRHAPDRIAFGWGHFHRGHGPLQVVRLGLDWVADPWVQRPLWNFGVYTQLSASYWYTNWREGYSREQQILALSPIFQLQYRAFYAEFGVGGAWVTRNRFANRNMVTHGHFEDRIGLGVTWGPENQYRLGYVCLHYSNAGASKPNNGLDTHVLQLAVRF